MEVVAGVVIVVVLVIMLIVRLRFSISRQEAARQRPLRSGERNSLIVVLLAAMAIGAWMGFR